MTPRTRAALDQARQALAAAARTEHDHRHNGRCPVCNPPAPNHDEHEHWTDR